MKKGKIGVFFGLFVVLAGLGLFFGHARAKAASENAWLWTAPQSALEYADDVGYGVRAYISSVIADENGEFDYARIVTVTTYTFSDGSKMYYASLYNAGSGYFSAELADLMAYYLSQYGSGGSISSSDRAYIVFNPSSSKFILEFRGSDYTGFLIRSLAGHYQYGYAYGHSKGYSEGYSDGLAAAGGGADEAYSRGYDDGYSAGSADGYEQGYEAGLADGYVPAYNDGYRIGYDNGHIDGYEEGESAGYARGYEEGESAGYGHGYDTGYDLGLEIGREEGYENGYNVGYDEGFSAGHDEGYDQCLMDFGGLLEDAQQRGHDEGYSEGFDAGYDEASSEIYALGSVIPAGIGSIWLVVRDFLSIEVLGMAIWEIIAAFVAIGVAILLVRMFL